MSDGSLCSHINLDGLPSFSFLLILHRFRSFFTTMQSTQSSFVPFRDALPPSRSTTASIWAPQPQPSDTAWSKAIDAFSQANLLGNSNRPEPRRLNSLPASRAGEDIFGPIGPIAQSFNKKDVGAIGDGRKKLTTSHDELVSRPMKHTYDSIDVYMRIYQHVEQLLRTLNLNSPVPFNQTVCNDTTFLSSPVSPDLSPISSTSAPLTPADLSPAKMLDVKISPSYDFGTVYSAHNNALLFETGASNRFGENVLPSQTAIYRSSQPATAGVFPGGEPPVIPFFEPFSENASAVNNTRVFNSTLPPFAHSRVESSALSPLLLSQQSFRTSPEWVKTDDRQTIDYASTMSTTDSSLRVLQQSNLQTQTQAHVHAHEVNICVVHIGISANMRLFLAYQLPFFVAPLFHSTVPSLCC